MQRRKPRERRKKERDKRLKKQEWPKPRKKRDLREKLK